MHDQPAARTQRASDAGDDRAGIGHEAKHPARIGEVERLVVAERLAESLHVAGARLEVLDAAGPRHLVGVVDERARLVDADDRARRRHQVSQVERGVAGPAADVEHALAEPQTGAPPGVDRGVRPQPVLQRQPRQLVLAGPENVFALCHDKAIFAPTTRRSQP